MSNKKEKRDTTKNTSTTKKIPILKLDNGKKILAKYVYMKDSSKCFGISDIDINKIRISDKSLYSKQQNEHNNEYIPLRITLKDLVGCFDIYKDDKGMIFKINDELSDKIYQSLENIFEHIGKNVGITLNDLRLKKRRKLL